MAKKSEKAEETAVVESPQNQSLVPQNQSAESLIAKAIDNNTSVETMEKLLSMRRELKAEWAKEQYDKAMADFQGECPVIKKDKAGGKTAGGAVAYYYAPLDSIVGQVKDILKKHGLSYSIKTEMIKNDGGDIIGVKSTCITKHVSGHSESSDVEVPLGTKTNVMSASQVVASASTFSKRYAFCNAFGILTGDDDDDSKTTGEETKKSTAFEKLMKAVQTADLPQLHDYKKKMEKSDKYTKEEKAEFTKVVDDKIASLETAENK